MYEFLHLSFQEYLTAKAIVKRFIPLTDSEAKIVEIIKPNIGNENWKEVIPLVAVLLERETKDLIEYLISESKIVASKDKKNNTRADNLAPSLLGSCLANEIQISPIILESAIEWYAKNGYNLIDRTTSEIILNNKFGNAYRSKIKELYCTEYSDTFTPPIGSLLSEIFGYDIDNSDNSLFLSIDLKSESKSQKCFIIIGLMGIAWRIAVRKNNYNDEVRNKIKILNADLLILLNTKDKILHFSICWYLSFASEANLLEDTQRIPFAKALVKLWMNETSSAIIRVLSWSLTELLTPDFDKTEIKNIKKLKSIITTKFNKPANEFDKLASIYLGSIVGEQFNKEEIMQEFKAQSRQNFKKLNSKYSLNLFANKFNIDIKELLKETK